MSQIFISYSSKDRPKIRVLAKILEQEGLKVWWDKNIAPGKTFDRAISKALDDSACILVLWSKNSVKSDWVLDEAYEGLDRKILLPAMLDNTRIPFGYRRIQAVNLTKWTGGNTGEGIKRLCEAALTFVKPAVKPSKKSTAKPSASKKTRVRRLSGALDGKTIVFTGKLSESRNAHAEKVNAVGARFVNSVSGKTDYLVVGKEPGDNKLAAAEKYGTKKLTERKWLNILNDAYKRILMGKVVVFTGKLDHPRTMQEEAAKKLGAKITGTVSSKTNFLVVGDKPGKSKLDAAKKYDVEVISENLWYNIVSTLQ